MGRIEDFIEVNVPVSTAYNQWTQFEEFPRFMEGVERVAQLGDDMLDWTASIGGQQRHWRARIVEQVPDRRIAWTSVDGTRNDGTVTFQPLGPNRTRIALAMDVEPDDAVETVGDALGIVDRRVRGDLERFRDFIEQRGVETGAWRGTLPEQPPRAATPVGPAREVTAQSRPMPVVVRDGGGEEGTGRGFAEGVADPSPTRRPVGAEVAADADDEEATGRGFAEGVADPSLTRRPSGATVERIAGRTGR